jgi:hypothetical protein
MHAAFRGAALACLVVLAAGCASQTKEQASQLSAFQRDELPPPDLASMRESDVSPIPDSAAAAAIPPSAAAASKPELLGEMSDSSPGAARVAKGPCNLANCGVVLGIANHQAAESLYQDDGGPGTYLPQGVDSAETAAQPAVSDATGVQKIVTVWDIAVRMHDGTVRQVQQRSQPLLQIGDTVFVNADGVQLWN